MDGQGCGHHTLVILRGPSCSLHCQSPSHPGGEILHISDPRDHTTCGLFGLAMFTECHLPGWPTLWWLPRSSAYCGCTTVPVRLRHVPSTAHLRTNIWVVPALRTVDGATVNMRGQVSRGHVLLMLLGRHPGVARCHGAVPPAFSRMDPSVSKAAALSAFPQAVQGDTGVLTCLPAPCDPDTGHLLEQALHCKN